MIRLLVWEEMAHADENRDSRKCEGVGNIIYK